MKHFGPFVLVFLAFSCAHAPGTPESPYADLADAMNRAMRETGTPGAVLAIVSGGTMVYLQPRLCGPLDEIASLDPLAHSGDDRLRLRHRLANDDGGSANAIIDRGSPDELGVELNDHQEIVDLGSIAVRVMLPVIR